MQVKTFLLCILSLPLTVAAQGAATLSQPSWRTNAFQVTLSGESNRTYVIETSTNLQSWSPVLTNAAFSATRVLTVPAPDSCGYFRATALPVRPLFGYALLAKSRIDLAGNNLVTDSFDSEDPSKSTNGLYDSTKALDHGCVVAYGGITNSSDVGNLSVKGSVHIGLGFGVVLGPQSTVGDSAWVNSGQTGIQPGHLQEAVTREFPDAVLPSGPWLTPGLGVVSGVTYDYVLHSASYRLRSVGNSKVLVRGNAQLHVTGTIALMGSSAIIIAPGASLKLYAGSSAAFSGNGIINQTGNAANCVLYGTSLCHDLKIYGNGSFAGIIYAPNAHLSLRAGGSGFEHFSGAAIARSITFNGPWRVHYDEALQRGPAF